jgi:N-acetylneuraminic acid mutarotase
MPTGRYAFAAATVNGVVYAIGGHLIFGEQPPTDKVESYDPSAAWIPWWSRAPMPAPRGHTNGAVVIDGKIYVSGGYEQDSDHYRKATNSLFRYDPSTNLWSTRAPMPTPTVHGGSVAIDGKLYVYSPYGPALYRYDPASNSWSARAKPQAVQIGAAATPLGGKMYVIGGFNGSGALARVSVYNPVTNKWSTSKSLLTPRQAAAARTIDGRIYVVGGEGNGPEIAQTEVYNPATNTWIKKAGIPTKRGYPAAAAAAGKLYVIGGLDGSYGRTNEMYVP